jgi:hypothetical protein
MDKVQKYNSFKKGTVRREWAATSPPRVLCGEAYVSRVPTHLRDKFVWASLIIP